MLFSLLHLLANTSVFCTRMFGIADKFAQTAAMLAENTRRVSNKWHLLARNGEKNKVTHLEKLQPS